MQSVADMLTKGAKAYGWTLDGFTVAPDDTEKAIVHLNSKPDEFTEFTRHAALVDIGHKFDRNGFTVNYYNYYGVMPVGVENDPHPDTARLSNLVHHLYVSIMRAETKLLWPGGTIVGDQRSPNFKGLLAAGPLMREDGMQPRRVVLWDKGYDDPGRYVTHVQCVPDGTGETCQSFLDGGRYFRTPGLAVNDFTDRVKQMHMNIFPDQWR